MKADDLLPIGEVARRSGLAPSAIRYYEQLGLVTSTRTAGDRRRYQRSILRRLAVIRSAQNVGLSLDEIAVALAQIPIDAAPTKKQWHRISSLWRPALDRRIEALQALRANLDSCIGCGCLSMRQCLLFNPDDELGAQGAGPRRKVAILDPGYAQP
ncbi:MAG: redox-sensitive transcriptional activator SoxR [Actinobacteria bacterium]|jgi:MerR family redox-sensitive transcriptional activator SoxR|nr:redox-sensitive transcriptional activator SoxR [Actinomycetota bacterium]